MRIFAIGALVLFGHCLPLAPCRSAQRSDQTVDATRDLVAVVKPATADDLAIAEVVLSAAVKDKFVRSMWCSGDGTQIVLSSEDYENFHPANPNIVVADLNPLEADFKKAHEAPTYAIELDYTINSGIIRKHFPNAKALVNVSRPHYLNKERAVFYISGSGPHGMWTLNYTLVKQHGLWKIVNQNGSAPV